MKIRNNKFLFFLINIVTLFFSCKRDTEVHKKEIDGICYEVCQISKDVFQAQDTIQVADLLYFKFVISVEKGSDIIQKLYNYSNYNKLLYYVNTSIKNDFSIKRGESSFMPVQVFFENSNRLSNKLVFMLAFEKNGLEQKEITLGFDDKLFNNGILNFRF